MRAEECDDLTAGELLQVDPPAITSPTEDIPFTELNSLTHIFEGEFRFRLNKIIATSRFIQGQNVREFESAFARTCGFPYVIGCNSGTSALHLALRIVGVGPGDEVIVPGVSFIATAWPVVYAGATPIFCDIDSETYTLDPVDVERKITSCTKAVIAVHLYGQPANLDPLLAITTRYGISLIEDAAQAHLADYKGKVVGNISRIGCFSFYPSKNLGAAGEAGALVCGNEADATLARMLRDHGQ